jgi:hypothetical protein
MLSLSPSAFFGRKEKLFAPRNMIKMMAIWGISISPSFALNRTLHSRTEAAGGGLQQAERQTGTRQNLDEGVEHLP